MGAKKKIMSMGQKLCWKGGKSIRREEDQLEGRKTMFWGANLFHKPFLQAKMLFNVPFNKRATIHIQAEIPGFHCNQLNQMTASSHSPLAKEATCP